MIVFAPVSAEDAVALRSGVDLGPRPGCAATNTLRLALGDDTSAEEADFAALTNAGVLAVVTNVDPQRLVLAVETDDRQVHDRRTPTGEVEVTGLRWSQVQSLFADEAEAAALVTAARHAVGVSGLVEALAVSEVQDLIQRHDLLWFATEELDQLA